MPAENMKNNFIAYAAMVQLVSYLTVNSQLFIWPEETRGYRRCAIAYTYLIKWKFCLLSAHRLAFYA